MRKLLASLLFLSVFSCIPLSIAPNIKSEKIVKAKRFKRDLPRNYGFIFEDTKDADEFFNFMNMKFDLGYIDVESNVPFNIDGVTYFLSFYEREKITKTLNLIPIAVDLKRESNGNDPILEDVHTTRTGKWYLILTVTDTEMNDCLAPNYEKREQIVSYLRQLREEYFTTQNYFESYFKRN